MLNAPREPRNRSFVIAHRSGNAPESMLAAADLGAPLIEADVRWFRGAPVVRHLKHVGPLKLYWDTWKLAHPRTEFPTLEDVLAAVPSGVEIMLDLKGASMQLAAAVRAAVVERPALGRVTVCARSWQLLDAFDDVASVRCVRSVGSKRGLDAFLRSARTMAPGTGITIHRKLLDRFVVRELRAVTDLVMSWPVNELHTARVLQSWGVHGLISDQPEVLIEELSIEALREDLVLEAVSA
jgi:glycerophosphoryl diester phosphodiesterase